MRLLNSLRKLSIKQVRVLNKHFRIPIRVYYPAMINDKGLTGHFDMLYKDVPDFSGAGLCPHYFKYREYLTQSTFNDPFQEQPDIILWTDIQKPFPLYSKVIFDTDYKGITTFRIDRQETVSDDEGDFIHKCYLVPLYGLQEAHSVENISSELLQDKSLTEYNDSRDLTAESEQVSKFRYNPIK